MTRMMDRLVQARAHHARDADHDVEACVMRHFNEGRDAAAGLAHKPCLRAVIFDFRGRVRSIATLVLEALDPKGLRVPSGSDRGTKKQVTPSPVLASVKNASLMGAEQNHLWPSRLHVSPDFMAVDCTARRSEPPCFSVIAMPIVAPAFSSTRRAADRRHWRGSSVSYAFEIGRMCEHRNRRESHRHGTRRSHLELVPEVEECGARGKSARVLVPRQRMHLGGPTARCISA